MNLSKSDRVTIGAIPPGTTHFVVRAVEGTGARNLSVQVGNGVKAHVLPIEALSLEFIKERFGAGKRQVQFCKVDESGKARVTGTGRRFEIEGPEAVTDGAEEPATAPEEPAAPPPRRKKKLKVGSLRYQLRLVERIEAIAEKRVTTQVQERTQFLQAEAQRNREHMALMMELVTKASQPAAPLDAAALDKMVRKATRRAVEEQEDPDDEEGDERTEMERILGPFAPTVNTLLELGGKIAAKKLGVQLGNGNDTTGTNGSTGGE